MCKTHAALRNASSSVSLVFKHAWDPLSLRRTPLLRRPLQGSICATHEPVHLTPLHSRCQTGFKAASQLRIFATHRLVKSCLRSPRSRLRIFGFKECSVERVEDSKQTSHRAPLRLANDPRHTPSHRQAHANREGSQFRAGMATLVVQQSHLRPSRSPSPMPSGVTLDATKFKNRHIPYCPPGAASPSRGSRSSTPVRGRREYEERATLVSILHPSKAHKKVHEDPPVFAIDAGTLAAAERQIATTPLPDPKLVFPWLHGLHPENQIQLAFFMARRRNIRKTPAGIRGLTIVKAGSDLTKSKLKGAILADEILAPAGPRESSFPDMDPRDGFSVRNFQIQAAKLATISDIIVYKDDKTSEAVLFNVAKKISSAQRRYRETFAAEGGSFEEYGTFMMTSSCRNTSEKRSSLTVTSCFQRTRTKVPGARGS